MGAGEWGPHTHEEMDNGVQKDGVQIYGAHARSGIMGFKRWALGVEVGGPERLGCQYVRVQTWVEAPGLKWRSWGASERLEVVRKGGFQQGRDKGSLP